MMESKFKIKDKRRHANAGVGDADQLKRDFQLHFLKKNGLEHDHHFLDVGCGSLRGGIPIIDYLGVGHYVGVETRKEAFDAAQVELSHYPQLKKKNPELFFGNLLEYQPTRKFEYIWAFAVLYHVPDEDLSQWFSQIEKCLAPGGVFYGNIHQETHSQWGDDIVRQEYPVLYRTIDYYQTAAAPHGLVAEDIGPLSKHGRTLSPDRPRNKINDHDGQRMLVFRRKQ